MVGGDSVSEFRYVSEHGPSTRVALTINPLRIARGLPTQLLRRSQPATTTQHLKAGNGSVRFLTLLAPLRPGQKRRVLSAEWDGVTALIEFTDGRTVTVNVPEDSWAELTASVD